MTAASTLRSVLSDAELILATRAGDSDAYGQLYVRHLQSARAAARALTRSKSDSDDVVAEAFSRVLSVLQRGGGPDISFRPYLLTTVRNSFYERTRRTRLEDTTDQPDDAVNLALLDAAGSGDDRAIVAAAFASLPERWQLVLWHTEVEGRSAAEVAPLLGIAANAVAALAYRAREGLRQAYLQSHLQQPMADACHDCVSNLGAYVRDSLPARERRRVDDHLATCATCPPLLAELSDANTKLRGVLIPLLIGVPAAKYLAGLSIGKGVLATIRRIPGPQQVALGTMAASVVAAVAIVTVSLVGPDESSRRLVAADPNAIIVASTNSPGTRQTVPITSDSSAGATDSTSATDSSTEGTDPVDTTPSNTLPSDTVDAAIIPPTGTTTVGPPPAAPNTSVRTTPSTQPRTPTTQQRPPFVVPPFTPTPTTPATPTTAADTPANTPTIPGTTPTTPATQATTPGTTPTTPATVPTTPATEPTAAPTTTISTTTTTTVPPVIAVSAEIVGPAYINGTALIRITIDNGTAPGAGSSRARLAGPAVTVRILPLPAGVTFSSVSNPAWTCEAGLAAIVCELPGLADGASSSADIKLGIGASASSVPHTLIVSADGVVASVALFFEVRPSIPDAIYADYDNGSVLIIGNSSMTCNDKASTRCLDARRGVGSDIDLNRHAYDMIYVDSQAGPDSDGHDPFNSSRAALALGNASVTKAYLVWAGDTTVGRETSPAEADKDTVWLTTPDEQVHKVESNFVSLSSDDETLYSAFADVTSLVRGQSSDRPYQVADIQAAQGREGMAGWSLVVVTHDPAAPLRLLVVTVPDTFIDRDTAFSLEVPLPDPAGPSTINLAIASFEGDRGLPTDELTIGSDPPILNAFNGTVRGAIDSVNVNNFGVDSDLFITTVTGPDLVVSAESTQDRVRFAMFAFSVDL